MKVFKYIVAIIIILVIIIIILTGMIIYKSNKKNDYEIDHDQYIKLTEETPAQVLNGNLPEKVKMESVYFTVEECIYKYLQNISENNTEVIDSIAEGNKVNISITNEGQVENFIIQDMYSLVGESYAMYYTSILIDDTEEYIQVNIDHKNQTYSILELDKQTYNNIISNEYKTNEKEEKTILPNKYNHKESVNLTTREILEKYMKNYKLLLDRYPEKAYEILDDNYKKENNVTLDNLVEYVEENNETINEATVVNYTIENTDANVKYTCIDNHNNQFIFTITSVMNYTITPVRR